MTRRVRIIQLIVFLIALGALNILLHGSITLPTGDFSIWLHGGLLMMILGAYWIEPFFTKPADVVINALIVFISVSTLNEPPYEEWWALLRYFSLLLIFISFLVIWLGSPAIGRYDTSGLKRFFYLLVIRLGNAKVIFSFVFILALISYFDLKSINTKIMIIFWGIVLSVKHLEIDSLISSILSWKKSKKREPIGFTSRICDPNIILFHLLEDAVCRRGSIVAFTHKGIADENSPIGIAISHRRSPQSIEVEAFIIDSNYRDGQMDRDNTVIKVNIEDDFLKIRAEKNNIYRMIENMIGFATKRSDIGQLYFELIREPKIEEGHLVASPLGDGRNLLFQVINGKLTEEYGVEKSERAFTIGEAGQIGTWSNERQGFETYSWVVRENAPIFRVSEKTDFKPVLKEKILDIGNIPNSMFPVNINLQELVLYHSAILGVTGSGKTFLAYHLIENCAQSGIKVICMDVTGDHKRYLRNPVLLNTLGTVKEFLDHKDDRIGVVEFAEEKRHPIQSANDITRIALEWAKKNRLSGEIKEPIPKVLLVLEEAHVIVPEWNYNPKRELQDTVNNTSQSVLQARKYGLGFMVITQRTANVTKSILNQCNTIFAFQAYDETGFDFMKNYMGVHYVQALPNLKKRQGILVGKASVSDRPIIVRFYDQDREATGSEIPIFSASS